MQIVRTDCLIAGGGLAACIAADGIAKKGRSVVLLRTGSGASPFVHGINIPLHEKDGVQSFVRDTLAGGYGQGRADLVRTLCEGSLGVVDTVRSLGLDFNRDADGNVELLQPLGASFPRVVSVGNALGAYALSRLEKKLEGRITVRSARAVRLFREEGAFCALCFEKGEPFLVTATAVVLATGGYGRLWSFSTNGKDVGGDGIAMAYGLGAALTDMEFVQFEPSVAVAPEELRGKSVITTMFYDGAVLRNRFGERFMTQYSDSAERVNKDVLARAIGFEIEAGNATENGGVYFDCTAVGREKLQERYGAYYKRYLSCGIDLAEQPAEIAAGAHTTLGGVEIDSRCRTCVEGLFVCGEAAGGIHGANRLGGNAGLETFVFGKIAGETADEYLQSRKRGEDRPAIDAAETFLRGRTENSVDVAPVREQLGRLMTECLGVVRSGEKADKILGEIAAMREALPCSADEGCLRAENDLTAAYLTAVACKERRGSKGCHYRTDGITEQDGYFIRIGQNGIRRIDIT